MLAFLIKNAQMREENLRGTGNIEGKFNNIKGMKSFQDSHLSKARPSIKEELTQGLDRVYHGPKLSFKIDDNEEKRWPYAFELEMRNLNRIDLESYHDNDDDDDNYNYNIMEYNKKSADNILEIVVGRKLLGYVRKVPPPSSISVARHSSNTLTCFELTYCGEPLIYCIKQSIINRDDNSVKFIINMYDLKGSNICEIMDDGGKKPSMLSILGVSEKLVKKKRKITKFCNGEGEETHRIMYHYTPGVMQGYLFRRNVGEEGEGEKIMLLVPIMLCVFESVSVFEM